MILYPLPTLHRVEPVTSGTRLAVVDWVQSLLRDQDQREILFDLEQSRPSVRLKGNPSSLTADPKPVRTCCGFGLKRDN